MEDKVSVTKLGSSSYDVYETTFLDLKVKYANVEGTNMYHVKSFVDSYNAANELPIMEFTNFVGRDNSQDRYIPKYLERFAAYLQGNIPPSSQTGGVPIVTTDENGRWNIPSVIVYCYSNKDNTRGYWVRGEVLSRYAQKGNIDFAIMVDMLIASIAEHRVLDQVKLMDQLTLVHNKTIRNNVHCVKTCNQITCYIDPTTVEQSILYVEYFEKTNEILIGYKRCDVFKKWFDMKDENGKPAHVYLYRKLTVIGDAVKPTFIKALKEQHGDKFDRIKNGRFHFALKTTESQARYIVTTTFGNERKEKTIPPIDIE